MIVSKGQMKVVIVGVGGWITATASTIENLDVTIVSTDLVETIGVLMNSYC